MNKTAVRHGLWALFFLILIVADVFCFHTFYILSFSMLAFVYILENYLFASFFLKITLHQEKASFEPTNVKVWLNPEGKYPIAYTLENALRFEFLDAASTVHTYLPFTTYIDKKHGYVLVHRNLPNQWKAYRLEKW